MSEDTSSSPRQEWYEADYEPDEPPVLQGSNLRLGPLNTALEQLTRPKVGEVAIDRSGMPIGVIMSIDPANQTAQVAVSGTYVTQARQYGKSSIGVHIHVMVEKYAEGLKKIADSLTKSGLVESNPDPKESPRERALRLKQKPHSMTGKDGKFDTKGRCRY